MKPTRVVLAGLPRMLSDIVESTIAASTTVKLVGVAPGREALPQLVGRRHADVVVVGEDESPRDAENTALLRTRPGLRVLAVAQQGQATFLYELRPHRVALGQVSPQQLLGVIQGNDATVTAERSP